MATKSRRDKTATQLWVHDNRKRMGLKPDDLARLTGVTVDTARGWESRGRPSADAIAILERHFGAAAPEAASAPGDQAGVIEAIDRLTAAIERQTNERVAWEQGLIEAIAELLQGGARSAAPSSGPLEGVQR